MNRSAERPRICRLLAALLALGATCGLADDSPLTIADLDAYRLALEGKPDETPVAVGFHELWEQPRTYQGHRVRVEGKVARSFRQGAVGSFPPLAEVWAVSPAGNPLCLVFSVKEGRKSPAIGATVRFTGTFLTRVEYQGGDGARLAPLIVGDRPPALVGAAPSKPPSPGGLSTLDWAIGLAVAGFVVFVLLVQHLRKPRGGVLDVRGIEHAPEFVARPGEGNDDRDGMPAS